MYKGMFELNYHLNFYHAVQWSLYQQHRFQAGWLVLQQSGQLVGRRCVVFVQLFFVFLWLFAGCFECQQSALGDCIFCLIVCLFVCLFFLVQLFFLFSFDCLLVVLNCTKEDTGWTVMCPWRLHFKKVQLSAEQSKCCYNTGNCYWWWGWAETRSQDFKQFCWAIHLHPSAVATRLSIAVDEEEDGNGEDEFEFAF